MPIADLIREDSSFKSKTLWPHSWIFFGQVVGRYEPRRSSVVAVEADLGKKAKHKRPKQGLADHDKAAQKDASPVLQSARYRRTLELRAALRLIAHGHLRYLAQDLDF